VYGNVVAGVTTGLGEGMARLVRGPEWARMGTNEAQAVIPVADEDTASVKETAV